MGVAAAEAARGQVLVASVAGLVAGAMSMAAGEYVSVSSQSDTEEADLERERVELEGNEDFERAELASIYVGRGLDDELAREVARQLMEHDALGSHARDELRLTTTHAARPIQAAIASAAAFSIGAVLPLGVVVFVPRVWLIPAVGGGSLISLGILGALAARAGGAGVLRSVLRVTFWGALAMALTALVGRLFGAVV